MLNQYAHQSTIFQLKLQETLKEMTAVPGNISTFSYGN